MSSPTLSTLYSDALRSVTGFLCLREVAMLYRCCVSLHDQLDSMQPATSLQLQLRSATPPKSFQRLRTWITHLGLSFDALMYDHGERRLAAAVPNLTSLCISFSDYADETEGDLEQFNLNAEQFDLPAGLHSVQLLWFWSLPSRCVDSMLGAVQQFGAITSLTLEGRDQPFNSDPFLQGLHALSFLTSFKLVLLDRGVVRSLIKLSRADMITLVTHPTLTSLDLQEGHLSEAFVQMLLSDDARALRSRLHYLRVDLRWINKNVQSLLATLDGICLQLRH